jgi:integrase
MRLHSCAATPERQKSGKRTINSYLRCARSLFAKRIQEALTEITWPDPIPFASVRFERGVKPPRYQSKIDPSAIIAAANKELRPEHPELYKIFLLALTAGLRKGEIDWLEWNAFDWSKGLIRLANTAFLQLKTEESQGEVPLDPEVMAVFRNYFSAAQGRFVVDAGRRRLPKPSQKTYRCEKLFRRLNDWLRSQGISANKPLHELRKELGALVASNHGIYAAKEILRHANIGTTVAHYADQKNRVSVGLGSILEGSDGETDERNP